MITRGSPELRQVGVAGVEGNYGFFVGGLLVADIADRIVADCSDCWQIFGLLVRGGDRIVATVKLCIVPVVRLTGSSP